MFINFTPPIPVGLSQKMENWCLKWRACRDLVGTLQSTYLNVNRIPHQDSSKTASSSSLKGSKSPNSSCQNLTSPNLRRRHFSRPWESRGHRIARNPPLNVPPQGNRPETGPPGIGKSTFLWAFWLYRYWWVRLTFGFCYQISPTNHSWGGFFCNKNDLQLDQVGPCFPICVLPLNTLAAEVLNSIQQEGSNHHRVLVANNKVKNLQVSLKTWRRHGESGVFFQREPTWNRQPELMAKSSRFGSSSDDSPFQLWF